jgi:hypothetical protein
MRRVLILLGAAALAACNAGKLTADEVRNALPYSENAQVGAPGASAAAAQKVIAPAAVSDSDFFRLSGALAASVNVGVGAVLGTVRFVVSLPPTSCQADTCTWGPWTSALEYNTFKLEVTRNGDQYDWALSGQPKTNPSAGFSAFVYGSAIPGSAPRRGHGTVTVDFEAAKLLDGPHDDDGRIDCQYDARGPLHLGCSFLGMIDRGLTAPPGSHVNAAYDFQATATGGDLQVAWHTLPPNVDQTLSLHSRWDANGAGRGDLEYVQGDLTYRESECWGGGTTAFALVFDTNPVSGDETACAFSPADYATLAVP